MSDNFSTAATGLTSPGEHAAAVTPSNSTDMAQACRALYIGVSGDVKVTTTGGETVTFVGVPIGPLPMRCVRVFATGTTATNIIAIW